ncbi:hypothetical protein KFL_002960050 [Klebsormidium nitens]|uniref:Uncharacterized protein n=1 Tax=Klebsormidium nitens TaxID=105231 RepID=A0A1Y1I6H2_KLENI|nr:hypothetical protein KFL_002960050 [Klebsormidium nitens]|eukprot:GAQ86550.1 hypothetical protein KFL_002960050 [Klebsormidium nitens]
MAANPLSPNSRESSNEPLLWILHIPAVQPKEHSKTCLAIPLSNWEKRTVTDILRIAQEMAPLKTRQLKDQIELRFQSSGADSDTLACMGNTPLTVVQKWILEEGPWPADRKAWPQLWGVLSPAADNQATGPPATSTQRPEEGHREPNDREQNAEEIADKEANGIGGVSHLQKGGTPKDDAGAGEKQATGGPRAIPAQSRRFDPPTPPSQTEEDPNNLQTLPPLTDEAELETRQNPRNENGMQNGTAVQERGQTGQLTSGCENGSAPGNGSLEGERKRKLGGSDEAGSSKRDAETTVVEGAEAGNGEMGGETRTEKRRKRANGEVERRRSKSGEKAGGRKQRNSAEGIVGVKARTLRRQRPALGSYLAASKGIGQLGKQWPDAKTKLGKKAKTQATVPVESLVGRWGRRKWRMKEGRMKGFNGKVVKGPRDPKTVKATDKCYTFVYEAKDGARKDGKCEREKLTMAQVVAAVEMYKKAVASGECEAEENEGEEDVVLFPTVVKTK